MKCNLQGTINVLELAWHHDVKRVLFASTREVYGKNEDAEQLNESAFGTLDPLDDRSCYPESKRAAESLLKSYALQYGVLFNTVRIAHSYGPTMNLENDGRVMADLISDVVAGRSIVLKSTGTAVRAFLYVTDAVIGMFTVLFLGEPSTAYNLANETEPISIKDLALLLTSFRKDIDLKLVYDTRQQVNTKGYCTYKRIALDTRKSEALGWSPHISLKEGLTRTFIKTQIGVL
jgi:nucleoside-diphosphate-sugar epimerase